MTVYTPTYRCSITSERLTDGSESHNVRLIETTEAAGSKTIAEFPATSLEAAELCALQIEAALREYTTN